MIVHQRTGIMVLLGGVGVALIVAIVLRRIGDGPRERVPWDHPRIERDLGIIGGDTLRILVLRDALTWERRPQAVSGLEFELMERFARHAGLVCKAIPVDDPDTMFAWLQRGAGDVIAAQFTERSDRSGWVDLSLPYHAVRPMLATLREDGGAPASEEDAVVSVWSPFLRSADEKRIAGRNVIIVKGTPEGSLMDVVLGRVQAAVVTDATAGHEGRRFPTVQFVPLGSSSRSLHFAVRTNAPVLLRELDAWIGSPKEQGFRKVLLDTYLDRLPVPGALRKRRMPAASDSISPYDEDFKRFGGGMGWRWQLLTAMAWKESRFDSTAVSTMGAQGIMQFMPATAAHFGVDSAVSVGAHIEAAKRYIGRLDTIWMRAVPDRDQRLRFVLASYNAGVGHIIDAQRLADHLGLDPRIWEDNVERAVLLLAKPAYYMRPEMKNGFCKGSQVFHYVRDIVALYHQLTGLPRSRPKPASSPSAPAPAPDSPPILEEEPEEAG